MPIAKSNELISLIKSLTKAEKRNFKLYAGRNQNDADFRFIELFDILEKMDQYDEDKILKNFAPLSKAKLANLKRHLYTQILSSLRVITVSKRPNIEVREMIDFAYILYDKSLYIEALKILKRAKKHADKYHLYNMYLAILEFEKKIESRHITRSGKDKAFILIDEAEGIRKKVSDSIQLSNLRIRLHATYLENGHSQSEEENKVLETLLKKSLEQIDEDALGLVEKVYLYQSYVWYYHILLDFESCLHYSEKWLELLENNPSMIERDVDLYLRAHHYVLSSCFHLRNRDKHNEVLANLEYYRKSNYKRFSELSKIISFQYVHTGRLNKIIIEGNFDRSHEVISRVLRRIKKYQDKLDSHKILVFYFKIAWIHFGNSNYSKAIFYLNRIVNNELPNLRVDLQIYSRILFLMCHYELGNFDIFQYSITSFRPYINKVKREFPVLKIVQEMFLKVADIPRTEHKPYFKECLSKLKEISANSVYGVSFTYLDVISWLESKMSNTTLAAIIKKKD